jgi:hypothetical protein
MLCSRDGHIRGGIMFDVLLQVSMLWYFFPDGIFSLVIEVLIENREFFLIESLSSS